MREAMAGVSGAATRASGIIRKIVTAREGIEQTGQSRLQLGLGRQAREGRARSTRKTIRKLTASGTTRPARRDVVVAEMMPTSQGSTPPPRPAAPKKSAPTQVESSLKIAASQVTKIGYCGARPKPAMA